MLSRGSSKGLFFGLATGLVCGAAFAADLPPFAATGDETIVYSLEYPGAGQAGDATSTITGENNEVTISALGKLSMADGYTAVEMGSEAFVANNSVLQVSGGISGSNADAVRVLNGSGNWVLVGDTGSIDVQGSGSAIRLSTDLEGYVLNVGSITTESGNAIQVDGDSSFALLNYLEGTITTQADGIHIDGVNNGAIVSNGLIDAGGTGISIAAGNSGNVRIATGFFDLEARIIAGEDGIRIGDESYRQNGAYNSGLILVDADASIEAGRNGVLVVGENRETGVIANAGRIEAEGIGLYLAGRNDGGTIRNDGSISNGNVSIANTGGNAGLIVNNGSMDNVMIGIATVGENSGTVSNSETGSIHAGFVGIYAISQGSDPANTGVLENLGRIDSDGYGIISTNASGGYVGNRASGVLNAQSIGMLVDENQGVFENAGAISSGWHAMYVSGSNTGLVRNTGSLASVASEGMLVSSGNSGHVMNIGTIGSESQSVGGGGIIVVDYNSGVISNLSYEGGSASIHSVGDGIQVYGDHSGLIENEGEIYTQSTGIRVTGNMFGSYTADDGQRQYPAAITNSGLIDAVGDGIRVDGNIELEDSHPVIVNSGTILSASGDGIYVGGDSVASISNEGYIGISHTGEYTFAGDNGIQIVGTNNGSIINEQGALIQSVGDGILIGETFLAGAGEDPDREAVYSDNASQIINRGSIVSQDGHGISITGNTASFSDVTPLPEPSVASIFRLAMTINQGEITSALDGMHIGGDNDGYTRNLGSIISTSGNGMFVGGNNSGLLANDGGISADISGIVVEGDNVGYGRIVNSGSIYAELGTGIVLGGNNESSITNGNYEITDALISAQVGIEIGGDNTGSIVNYALIDTRYEGILVDGANSGNILNAEGASISSRRGSAISVGGNDLEGNSGSIINAGSIETRLDGISVYGENSGDIINEVTGTISSRFPGISVFSGDNTGRIENKGTINTDIMAGIYLSDSNSGEIFNYVTGVIDSENGAGILIEGNNSASGMIVNLGSITAGQTSIPGNGISISGDNAGLIMNGQLMFVVMSLEDDSSDEVLPAASITASNDGILVEGDNRGIIVNLGEIVAGASGIHVLGDSFGIQNSGVITSVGAGISVAGDSAILVVDGRITTTGEYANGIEVGANARMLISQGDITSTGHGIFIGGDVTEEFIVSGIINAGSDGEAASGLYVSGNSDSILSLGSIEATGYGIYAGAVTTDLLSYGSITSTLDAIHIEGDIGSILELDGIIDSGAFGVNITGSVGKLSNDGGINNYGQISGVDGGITVHGDVNGIILNSGSISASGAMGEGLTVYGSVDGMILNTGTISAGMVGIGVAGDVNGDIVNRGTISTEYGAGIEVLGNVGLIANSGTINSNYGIVVMGGEDCTIINSGTIESTQYHSLGIGTVHGAEIINTGTISVTGEDSIGIFMLGDSQVFANAGSLISNGLAIRANGASSVYMGVIETSDGVKMASVQGDMCSFGSSSRIVFGVDLAGMRFDNELLGNGLFVMNYNDVIENFEAEFLGGTTNFGGTRPNMLRSSVIRAGATLNVNNTTVFVSSGDAPALLIEGKLGGSGQVSLLNEDNSPGTIVNNGTFAPGNSIGSAVIEGNFVSNGVLEIEIAPVAGGVGTPGVSNDHLTVASPIEGQTVNLVFGSGASISFIGDPVSAEFLPGSTYNIISLQNATLKVEGDSSTYSLIAHTDNLEHYSFYVVGDAASTSAVKNVYAIAARDHDYGLFARTANQKSVGAYLSQFRDSSTLSALRFGLDTTAGNANLNRALDLVSGDIYPTMVAVEANRVSALAGKVAILARPSSSATAEESGARKAWRSFAQMDTSGADATGDDASGLRFKNYGVLAGAGRAFGNGIEVGGFVGMSKGKIDNDHPDRVESDNQDLGLYLSSSNKGDYYIAMLSYGASQYDVRRRAASSVMNSALVRGDVFTEAETDASYWSAYAEKGWVVVKGDDTIHAFMALNYARYSFDDLSEKGGSDFALDVDFASQDSLRSVLGIRFERALGRSFSMGLNTAWTHEFCDVDAVSSSLGGATGRFAVKGVDLGSDLLTFDAVLSANISDGFSIRTSFGITKSINQSAYSASIGGSYVW